MERLQHAETRGGLDDFTRARQEYHGLSGTFEDSEPCFELRSTMFLEWYLLDRLGDDGLTPAERLLANDALLSDDEKTQLSYLCLSGRYGFEVIETRGASVLIETLGTGARFLARSIATTVGLVRGDMICARLFYFTSEPTFAKSIVLHPPEARATIREISQRAAATRMEPRVLAQHLDKMKLKLDRYSNVRIQHVYRYPGAELF
ncbi:MAG: hypothetical protein MUC50_13670 [Myxococcota bacterium]|nr:hypothetical protein [Myxococcota bacterium]